jgi:hypothetical protein
VTIPALKSKEDIMATSPRRSSFLAVVGLSTIAAAGIPTLPAVAFAQDHEGQVQSLYANHSKIWEDRGPIERLDLFWGGGSAERVPAGPFAFVAEDLGGTNPKANVRDVNGVLWGVKWDEEAQSEVAASRLAWAMGLHVDETYYVENATIVFPVGQRPGFQRIGPFIDKQGNFTSGARFKRWVSDQKIKGQWSFGGTPLTSEGGYSVLVLMNVIMANWDAKDSNNKLLSVPETTGTTDWYMVGDYGACFGKMGGRTSHSKYVLKDFAANPPVVRSVSGDTMYLEFKGSNASAHASVPIEGARFFANRAAQLTHAQVEGAFRAAHANEQDLHGFADAVYGRIRDVVTRVQ